MYVIVRRHSRSSAATVARLKVVEYASRTFTKTESSYGSTRCEQTIPTVSLRSTFVRFGSIIKRWKYAFDQAARYLDFLADYDIETICRAGSRHVNVDSISRMRACDVNGGNRVINVMYVLMLNIALA